MQHFSKFRKRDIWRNFSVAQWFGSLGSRYMYRNWKCLMWKWQDIFWSHLLSQIQITTLFPKDWWYSVQYKVVIFFPFTTYTQVMFSASYAESLFNILHESPSHNQCQCFFAVTFTFIYIFITGLYGIKKYSVLANPRILTCSLWTWKILHVFECLILYSAPAEKKNIKNSVHNNLSNALFVYSAFFSLILCTSLVKLL